MGYYSNLALECLELDYDRSYPTPEKQLLWRLDDLYDRLDCLTEAGASYNSRTRLSDDDIRYAVPNYFEHIADVENAIELAMSELNFKKIIWQLPLPKEKLEIGYKKYECKGVQ